MTDRSQSKQSRLDRFALAQLNTLRICFPCRAQSAFSFITTRCMPSNICPFEEAVIQAAQLFGAEPYMSEAAYRAELAGDGSSSWISMLCSIGNPILLSSRV